MAAATGHDFSDVKVHTDPEAHALNEQLGAKAFTTGHDIFFRAGAYDPASSGGQELVAHELTHVVQQSYRAGQRWKQDDRQRTWRYFRARGGLGGKSLPGSYVKANIQRQVEEDEEEVQMQEEEDEEEVQMQEEEDEEEVQMQEEEDEEEVQMQEEEDEEELT